jgi:hypothetical protein
MQINGQVWKDILQMGIDGGGVLSLNHLVPITKSNNMIGNSLVAVVNSLTL